MELTKETKNNFSVLEMPGLDERTSESLEYSVKVISPVLDLGAENAGLSKLSFAYCFGTLSAAVMGLVLNLLDAVTYGLLIFPVSSHPDIFTNEFLFHGVSLFLISTITSQFVYSFGGSRFIGAVGSMMIEVMPFLNSMASIVVNDNLNSKELIIPTVVFLFALSSALTGIGFFLLGYFKCGKLSSYIPRPFLLGIIGGIGVFLVITSLEQTEVSFSWSLEFLHKLFILDRLLIILSSFFCVGLVKLIKRYSKSPYLVPLFYFVITSLFYILLLILNISVEEAREKKWIKQFLASDKEQYFYSYYHYIDLASINFRSLAHCIPTMLALVLFGLIHVPINLPALAITTHQEERYDVNRELIGHGISNFVSGLCFSLQNYVVYVNSVLVYNCGATDMVPTILMGILTIILLVSSLNVINFVPTVVVVTLLLMLGLDLVT
jgi:SulP family sulfate permease